jgi:hypothetical protein
LTHLRAAAYAGSMPNWVGDVLKFVASGGGLFMILLKPKLTIQTDKPYCRQLVYADGFPVAILRLYVENIGFKSTEARAWIESIEVNGKKLDPIRSPLNQWMDSNADHVKLGRGQFDYINFCQVHANNPNILFIRSVRGSVGYNIARHGLYRFTISVSGAELNTACEMGVEVRHDGTLEGLRFVSADQKTYQLNYNDIALHTYLAKTKRRR